jgi:hypothetical protein
MKNKNGLLKPYWNIKTYDGKYILYNMDEEWILKILYLRWWIFYGLDKS